MGTLLCVFWNLLEQGVNDECYLDETQHLSDENSINLPGQRRGMPWTGPDSRGFPRVPILNSSPHQFEDGFRSRFATQYLTPREK